jgi:hypothetical protein
MRPDATNHSAQPVQRDPDEWKTGDEPMTDAQRSYLETLCRETGEHFDDTLTKAEASKRIDDLRGRSPRLTDQASRDVDPDSAESEVDRDDTGGEA